VDKRYGRTFSEAIPVDYTVFNRVDTLV